MGGLFFSYNIRSQCRRQNDRAVADQYSMPLNEGRAYDEGGEQHGSMAIPVKTVRARSRRTPACLRARPFTPARPLHERTRCCKRSFLTPSLVYFRNPKLSQSINTLNHPKPASSSLCLDVHPHPSHYRAFFTTRHAPPPFATRISTNTTPDASSTPCSSCPQRSISRATGSSRRNGENHEETKTRETW